MQRLTIVAILMSLAVVIFVGLPVYSYIKNPLIVSVNGVGEVDGVATTATVSFSLSEIADNAGTALDMLYQKMATIEGVLAENAVPSYNLTKTQPQVVPLGLVSAGASGFQATISVAAKTSNIAEVSRLVALLYQQGATVVSQPVLSVDDAQLLEQQAMDKAMEDAAARARGLQKRNTKLFKAIASVAQADQALSSTASTKTLSADPSEVMNDSIKVVKAVTVTYRMW